MVHGLEAVLNLASSSLRYSFEMDVEVAAAALMQRKSCNTVRLTPHPHGPGVQGNNGL
jgi:hypothetical protein